MLFWEHFFGTVLIVANNDVLYAVELDWFELTTTNRDRISKLIKFLIDYFNYVCDTQAVFRYMHCQYNSIGNTYTIFSIVYINTIIVG